MARVKLLGNDHHLNAGSELEAEYLYSSSRPWGTVEVYDCGGAVGHVWVVPDEELLLTYEESYAAVLVEVDDDDNQIPTVTTKEVEDGTFDPVERPEHYNSHPSGVEAITITRHYVFAIGNAIKYLWRAGLKQDAGLTDKAKEIQDLKKAKWYIEDRIAQLEGETE